MIENIVVNFIEDTVNCYRADKSYKIDQFQELLDFKPVLEAQYTEPTEVKKAVFQLTEDQYGVGQEQRVILNPSTDYLKIVNLSEFSQPLIDAMVLIADEKVTAIIEAEIPIP